MSRISHLLCFIFLSLMCNQIIAADSENQLELNRSAPIFVLRDLNGNDVFLRDYCGDLRQPWKNKIQHVVILSFFTSYCQPCLKEIPILEKFAINYKDQDLKIFLLNLGESAETVQRYLNDKGFKLPVLLDKYAVVAKKYQVTSVPGIFVIDRAGNLIWKSKGYNPDLADSLDKVLEQQFKRIE
ncbi:redoxin domain-containing protein [candidate division KSB1 bacterium]|nr:redoxin domain-containing protein [candidate division KSB1 bacterium]